MSDKPLHVQVARALGWTGLRPSREDEIDWQFAWWGHHADDRGDELRVPHFDTDWSATGPLIEKYKIVLLPATPNSGWTGWTVGTAARMTYDWRCEDEVEGPTPLIAVCNLILALKEAGKL